MGLGAFHGSADIERRREIVNWFLPDERYPEDKLILGLGHKLLEQRLSGNRGVEVYEFPGVGRSIYLSALHGLINGEYDSPEAFPPMATAVPV